ncbi:hypothetical protein [Kitasatospora terrestris]|uniref:Integral membrane protein n=1 Tax=Kitasatospora terrestris TaxID=258051 RepID=A0ABP9DFF1_9ACTN
MTVHQYGGPMPRPLKFAIGGLVFQVLANGLVGLLLLGLSDGDDDSGVLGAIGGITLFLALVLAICAALVPRRLRWVRVTVTVIEGLAVLNGIVALFSGSVPGLLGIVLAIAILRAFNSPEGKAWFTV